MQITMIHCDIPHRDGLRERCVPQIESLPLIYCRRISYDTYKPRLTTRVLSKLTHELRVSKRVGYIGTRPDVIYSRFRDRSRDASFGPWIDGPSRRL